MIYDLRNSLKKKYIYIYILHSRIMPFKVLYFEINIYFRKYYSSLV